MLAKRISLAFIVLAGLFFAVGWIPVNSGWVSKDAYTYSGGIIGGIATVIGLLSLVRPPISRKDFENVEWESVAKIAESERQLSELESKKVEAHTELERLTRTRAELADLVKKASTVLFLKEELELSSAKLCRHLERHPELRKDLQLYQERSSKLKNLGEEIDQHPDAELISEVMRRAWRSKRSKSEDVMAILDQIPVLGPIVKLCILILDSYSRALKILVRF